MKHPIYELEIELLKPAARKSVERLDQLISDEFIEFGSSGKVYSKQDILQTLPYEKEQAIEINNFKTAELSEDVVLATYRATIDGVPSLRSSIWKRVSSNWKMIFHQGTITQ